MCSFFKALDRQVHGEHLFCKGQGQGPGIGLPWSLRLAIAPITEGAAVTDGVALPVSSIMHNATGRRGPARVFHSVLDYNGYGYLAQQGLVPCFEVDGLCEAVGFLRGYFLCLGICGENKENCGGKKAHFRP